MCPEPVEGRPAVELRWGPLHGDDAVQIGSLLTAAEQFDRTGPRILHGWRQQLAPITDEEAHTLAARTPDGRIVALGWLSVRPFDEPPRRVFLAGVVHPEYRGRGLGRHLLDWQVETSRNWQRDVGGDPIIIVASSAPLPDVRALLTDAGFAPTRVFAELSRPLPPEPARSPSEEALRSSEGERALSPSKGTPIVIERFSADRAEDVRLVLNASFADHWGSRPLEPAPWQAVLSGETFRRDWSWLAIDGGQVVGFVLNSAAPHPEHGTVGWTDQLGVLPQHRGRGVATALMEASLSVFEEAGLGLAGLGLDVDNPFGAPALYRRLGYRPSFEVHLYTRTEPAVPPSPRS